MTEKKIITSDLAPKPIGPYAPAILSGDLYFASGQTGVDPSTGELVPGGITAETRQTLLNCTRLLEAARGSRTDVLKTTVFLRDIADFGQMNSVYAEFFPDSPPVRTTIQAAALPKGAAVEIDLIARISPRKKSSRRRK